MWYRLAADLILVAHTGIVLFIVVGLVLILAGGIRGWSWVRNPVFRLAHLAAISVVVLQAWLGMICPLTTLEMWLRTKAGDAVYPGAFIAHWAQQILYYEAPAWVFALCYTIFGALVLASWFRIRPHPIRKK